MNKDAIIEQIEKQHGPILAAARHFRTFTDWVKRIDVVRIVVMAVVVAVEHLSLAGGTMTGPDKLNIAVAALRDRIGAGGWFGLLINIVLRILVSFAVAEMNTRYGKEWGKDVAF
jgi:hypothetical protein